MSESVISEVLTSAVVRFRWDYAEMTAATQRIYSQAKRSTWDPETTIDWSVDVEFGSPTVGRFGDLPQLRFGESLSPTRRSELLWHTQAWMLSQLLHGEQGGLVAAAKLVEGVPELDWKLCAASQVLDEAKHVEVFARYLDTKLECRYPISSELESLLTDIIRDPRWDVTYLGIQVLVEGFALGSFGLARRLFLEPLANQIVDYVLRDEARHVAFGMLALEQTYPTLTSAERAERMDLVHSSLALLRSRFSMRDVYERVGMKPDVDDTGMAVPRAFRRKAMSRIPPLLRRLQLWDSTTARLLEVEG